VGKVVETKVREESIKFGSHKKKKMAEKQEEIEQSIAFLEKKSCQGFYRCCCKTIEMCSELETKKRELDNN